MEKIRNLRYLIIIFFLIFWYLLSEKLSSDPSLTLATISFSLGMFAFVTIVIELVWRQSIEKQIGRILDSEMREKRGLLVGELHALISYLEKEKYPTFSDSETEELSNNLQALKSIKSKFTITPKIIWSTLFIALSSMLLFLYLINPTLLVLTNEQGQRLTLAPLGVALLMIGLWFLFDILTVVLEAKPWEKE